MKIAVLALSVVLLSCNNIHAYEYVSDNPVNAVDPLGLWIQYDTGTSAFWRQWRADFATRWHDPVFQQWWSDTTACSTRYRVGPDHQSTLPQTSPTAPDHSSSIIRAAALTSTGGFQVTHYGNPGDPYTDSGTRLQLGNHNNILNGDSVALSPDVAARMHLHVGDPVVINGHFLGYFQDSTAQYLTNRVDIYDPHGTEH